MDAASTGHSARRSCPGQCAAVPAQRAAGFRRLVPDDDARKLPHAHARDALCGDGPGRGVSARRRSAARLGKPGSRRARLPRTDTLVHTLDDLENLWDVAKPDRPRFARAIEPLLDHPEPLVRSAAAACLGRLHDPGSAAPLVKRLADPSKIVWRSAAWALRKLGNAGLGLGEIKAALDSPESATRRGAARIFAYQFYGMDQRLDLAGRLVELTRDPDLWTRLQSLRSLRQWFYRTSDPNFARRIIDTYLVRMAEPDAAVVRKNLSEGLYIMLDENLGGGVSLQKNLEELPAAMRARSWRRDGCSSATCCSCPS